MSQINSASWWVCERCSNHNPAGAGVCQNPNCGGEPVSRTIEAVATPAKPWVFNPARQCFTKFGIPKVGYASFDEAQEVATNGRDRKHAYRCEEHGWHVGGIHKDAA